MKYYYLWIIMAFLALGSCHEVAVGYLIVEQASYDKDSLVVRVKLDTASGDLNPEFQKYLDFGYSYLYIRDTLKIEERINYGTDYKDYVMEGRSWVSSKIQGVQGTMPVYTRIKSIESVDGNPEIMKKELKVRGDGTFILPAFIRSPVGRYRISLTFSNEGYSKDLDRIFTIIVTEANPEK